MPEESGCPQPPPQEEKQGLLKAENLRKFEI